MTVDMWTTCGRFLRGVARGASQGSCDVSEPAECPPSPPERDALVRRAMLRGVDCFRFKRARKLLRSVAKNATMTKHGFESRWGQQLLVTRFRAARASIVMTLGIPSVCR